jgi:hypothetical protein
MKSHLFKFILEKSINESVSCDGGLAYKVGRGEDDGEIWRKRGRDLFSKRFSLSGVYGVDGAVCELSGKGERLTCLSVSASLCSHS